MDIPLGHLRWRWMKLEIRAAVQPRSPGHQGELSNLDIWSSSHLNPDPNLALGLGWLSWRISGEDSDYVLVLSQCRSLKLSDILIPIDLMPSFGSSWWWVIHIYTRVSTLVIEEASFQSLFSKPIERGDDVLGLQDSGFWTHRYITSVRSV